MANQRYAMTVDTQRCVGCQACVLACKAENNLPADGFRDWIVTHVSGKYPNLFQQIRSERCNHCEHPPCVSCCPTGASHVNKGGTVLVTHQKCTGCKACIAACPYQARYVHSSEGYVDKCTFCFHRIEKDQLPACVDICPTKALTFGDIKNPNSAVSIHVNRRKFMTLQSGRGLKPHVYFLL